MFLFFCLVGNIKPYATTYIWFVVRFENTLHLFNWNFGKIWWIHNSNEKITKCYYNSNFKKPTKQEVTFKIEIFLCCKNIRRKCKLIIPWKTKQFSFFITLKRNMHESGQWKLGCSQNYSSMQFCVQIDALIEHNFQRHWKWKNTSFKSAKTFLIS